MPPFDQSRYQVRLDWGADALARLAPADVVVVVDVLRFSSTVAARVAAGESAPLDAATRASGAAGAATGEPGADGATVVAVASERVSALVLLGGLNNAAAVAAAVAAEQQRRAQRTSVALIPAGVRAAGDQPSGTRFAVEDLLGAGAIIDALGALGLDHTSPEAAVAGEAFRGLRGAMRHLLTASGSGQDLIDRGCGDDVLAAAALDSVEVAPVLRGGVFVPYR